MMTIWALVVRVISYTLLVGVGIATASLNKTLAQPSFEVVEACVITKKAELSDVDRAKIAVCLGWQQDNCSLCSGRYRSIITQAGTEDALIITANKMSIYQSGRSELSGGVVIKQNNRITNAQTAYIYHDAKNNKVTEIKLFDEVHYMEPGKLMIAKKVAMNMQDKSGEAYDVLYRFDYMHGVDSVPSWGRARFIKKLSDKNYALERATYTTCPPENKSWEIKADHIDLDNASNSGFARNASLRIASVPVLYTPLLSFPISSARKSGFLMPIIGSSSTSGFEFGLPYYWNIAPNYDATLTPHLYSLRGLLLGGNFRYLEENSAGVINATFLPDDKAFKRFLLSNETQNPQLQNLSSSRWSVSLSDSARLSQDLQLGISFKQVSDDYYLQDFSNNLAVSTERQLLHQGDLTYTTSNWLFYGMLQDYQTLNPINQTPIEGVYQRLPMLQAHGSYDSLPLNANLNLFGQFDAFHWQMQNNQVQPQGPRYHLNPALSLPMMKPWGYFTPEVSLVENYYSLSQIDNLKSQDFNRTIPRYNIDSGLYLERNTLSFTQTLEPRVYYLNVPFQNQTTIPVFDSGYMIFNSNQLFRNNRFSGFDRIGDANQLSYALTTRWLSSNSGIDKASLTIGQIRYFSKRQVFLCQSVTGFCMQDPETLGFLSPSTNASPIATRATYSFNKDFAVFAEEMWDPSTSATNNGNLNFHYQPENNQIIQVGYTYLVNGDITQVAHSGIQDNPLHQATIAYAWPFNLKWSSLAAYNYNISKRYEMMSFVGLQYDDCCWALRLLAGRTFQNLTPQLRPQYNNNIALQILLKGLGSVGNTDPSNTIRSYLPGYSDSFHN